MRLSRVFAIAAGIGLVIPALPFGCFAPADDCEKTFTCVPAATGGSTSGSGGSDAGTDPSCIPSLAKGPVAGSCGTWVTAATGVDTDVGSKEKPVATLARAIELAQASTKRVYACAESFPEAIVVPAGIEIYGGLDCKTGWTYSEAGRTNLTGPADQVPLKLASGVEGVTKIENVTIAAVDAALPGGSSIAAIVDNVAAELTRCDLIAGKGLQGADGETPTIVPDVGAIGMKGTNTCTAAPMGGAPGMTSCGLETSAGGIGGNGGLTAIDSGNGLAGLDGQPADVITGLGGAGAAGMMGACAPGGNGKDGDAGSNGTGGTVLGAISSAGYLGANGQDGGTGKPGQGGGGGGGYKAGPFCGKPGQDDPGPSGGGGGAGGCGGKGASGGKAGGSSIGLISLNATLTLKLTQVTITTGDGGKGGKGVDGHAGGIGGDGGKGGDPSAGLSKPGCVGGDGGYGGPGGSSGGGRGGHSIGVAYQGMTAPPIDGVVIKIGGPGEGGLGATGDMSGDGMIGMASMDPVQFPSP